MRLVIDGRRLTAGRTGVGRYLEALLLEWAGAGAGPWDEVVVVGQDAEGLGRVPVGEGLRTRVVGAGWPGLVWEMFGLGRVLRSDDLLFAPANLVPPTWRGRTVLVLHDAIQEILPGGFPRLVRWRFGFRYRHAARRADRVLVPSEATARDVARVYGVPAGRIRVVYQAPDPSFRPLPADGAEVREARRAVGLGGEPFFLFVGKRSARRNVPAILEAFARHGERHPHHRLVFVGPPREGDHPGVFGPGVILAGHVAEPVLRGLLADARALLYPSEYEGFGLPVVEAMASGCPVVTLRNSALVEAGGEAAWYLGSADPGELARAMHMLATDPESRARFVALGLDRAAGLSRSRFAEEVWSELVAVATAPRSRGPRPTRGA